MNILPLPSNKPGVIKVRFYQQKLDRIFFLSYLKKKKKTLGTLKYKCAFTLNYVFVLVPAATSEHLLPLKVFNQFFFFFFM